MKKIEISRRQVLRGAGGFTLGLPFLPSLVPVPAHAAEVSFRAPPRFVALATNHGGVREASMYPADTLLTETMNAMPGHSVRRGALAKTVQGTDHVLSTVLRAPSSLLTDRLISRMNVLRGLDIPFYIAHHTGGHLGNYARNDGNGSDGVAVQRFPMATIDQLMAWSPSFYKDLSLIKERALIMGMGQMSYGYSNPTARSGTIQEVRSSGDPRTLFNRIFVPPTMTSTPTVKRKPIVDLVLSNYKSLRQSNKRLSAADRQRLDDHIAQLSELERRLGTATPANCGGAKLGTGSNYELFTDVIAAAFTCGTSRIAVMRINEETFVNYSGDWHQSVAHQWSAAGPQQLLVDANKNVFQKVFVPLIKKLDVEEGNGATVLDNSFVMWTNESGQETHDSRSIPVITAGGAAGFLTMGHYVDYRNTAVQVKSYGRPVGSPGFTWNRLLGTVLQAMGLPRTEYEKAGTPGYGYNFVSSDYKAAYVNNEPATASELLPFLKA